MNITDQIPAKTPHPVDSPQRKIGIHIDLPMLALWQPLGTEQLLLQRLVCNALRTAGLMDQFDTQASWFLVFDRRLVGVVVVHPFGPAMNTVIDELAAVELLNSAQLAWADLDERIWHPERPNPAPVPFSKHIDDARAAIAKLKKMADMTPEERQAGIVDCLGQMSALMSKKTSLQPSDPIPPEKGKA